MTSDTSAFAVSQHESSYSDIFPVRELFRGLWLGIVITPVVYWAYAAGVLPIFHEADCGIHYRWADGKVTVYCLKLAWEQTASDAPGTVIITPLSPVTVTVMLFLFYVWSVLSLRMSRGFGIGLLAVMSPITLVLGGFGVLVSLGFWKELWKLNVGTAYGNIGLVVMVGVMFYYFILILKGGYRYVVSDNFTRMLVADLYKKRVFSIASLSRSLGLPFSMEHLRHRRAKILTYLVISNLLYVVFSLYLLAIPYSLGVVIGALPSPAISEVLFILLHNVGVASVCVAGGAWTRNSARRAARLSILELRKLDARVPILFLRAFRDDQVSLAPPRLSLLGYLYDLGRADPKVDVLLLEEGTEYGPVIALGHPSDPVPPYGAARGYFDNQSWQEAVARLAQVSSAIIICLDDTDGIWWEVDHIVANNMMEKTLFLIHPRNFGLAENNNLLLKVTQRVGLSDDLKEKLGSYLTHPKSPQGRVIGFFIDQHHSLRIARSVTFSRFAFRMILRWFMRTKLEARMETGRSSQVPANHAGRVERDF
jgi:hypothetical protein